MKNVLKITAFSLLVVGAAGFAAPHKAHALLLDPLFENAPNGPHCLFMDCDNNRQPDNIYINSNNTNSFNNTTNVGTNNGIVNAPYNVSTSVSTGGTTSGYNDYLPPAHVPNLGYSTSAYGNVNTVTSGTPSSGNYNYNYNYNGGGATYVPTPVYYSQPTYYQTPVYYSQPTYYTQPYQQQYYYQPTYTQPISYAPSIQIACAADVTSARPGVPVTWSAEATYQNIGSGFAYSWAGTDGLTGNGPSAIMAYYTNGTKSAVVTVTAPNGVRASKVCSNTVNVGTTVAKAPAKKVAIASTPKPTVTPTPTPEVSPAALLSLGNVPWGWVGVLIILVLLGVIFYLIFNKKKI